MSTTTSRFTKDAGEYANRIEKRIQMVDYGIGVAEVTSHRVQQTDFDSFGETWRLPHQSTTRVRTQVRADSGDSN